MITVSDVSKTFSLHNQDGAIINAVDNACLTVKPGECVALKGASGSGKSSLMRMIYGNYKITTGDITIGNVALSKAEPRQIIELRRQTLGYVSQFLRVIPRISTLEVVAEPILKLKQPRSQALERAAFLLEKLNIPENLWSLSPLTFSGGEQQRVNIARGFIHPYPALLLDEPTASLDAENRRIVVDLINEAKMRKTACIGIFHDEAIRSQVCDREYDVTPIAKMDA